MLLVLLAAAGAIVVAAEGWTVGTVRTCRLECSGAISACRTAAAPYGKVAGACAKKIVRRCRRDGVETCAGTATTTTTIPMASCRMLATGEEDCFDASGGAVPCDATGQDGDVRSGAPLAYVDNGDGTILDLRTGLTWEKLSDDGGIHDRDNAYSWSSAFAVKLQQLNMSPCFAGHCDWRIPNVRELASIVDYGESDPAVAPAFNTNCISACTVLDCSCTGLSASNGGHWSSTTSAGQPTTAWRVFFNVGYVYEGDKATPNAVRAVRGD